MGRIHLAEARRAKADGRGLQPRARQLTPSAIGAFRGRRIVSVPAQARACWRAHPFASGSSRAPVPCHRTGRPLVGCAVLGRLRHRGDPPRAARRRYRRAQSGDADRHRDCHHAGDRRLLLSADDSRLPQRRRRLHRREREPRAAAQSGSGRFASHRLRADCRRQCGRRRRGAHLGVARMGALPRGNRPRVRRRPDARQSARRTRVRTDLRGAHILLHRQHRECAGGGRLAIRHRRDRSAARVAASCHCHRPADHVCAADGLLERVHGDDRSRGGVQRGTGVPATGEPQCRGDAGRDGRPVDHDVPRDHDAGPCLRPGPEQRRNGRLADWRARRSAGEPRSTSGYRRRRC